VKRSVKVAQYKNSIEKVAGGWKAFAFDSRAAEALNKRFKAYRDVNFVAEGSEGIFTFADKDLPFVRAVLSKLGGLE
jgi:hypothetical protein